MIKSQTNTHTTFPIDPWAMLDIFQSALVIVDEQGTIQYRNTIWDSVAINGQTGTHMLHTGDDFLSSYHMLFSPSQQDMQAITNDMYAILQGKKERSDIEYLHSPPNDKVPERHKNRWFKMTMLPYDSNGIHGVTIRHREITEHKQPMEAIRIQRDLALLLSGDISLNAAIQAIVMVSMRIADMDGGGVYLVDKTTGAIDMSFHEGLPPSFVSLVMHYEADSPQVQLLKTGQAVYTTYEALNASLNHTLPEEDIRAIAVLPVFYKGELVASMHIISYTFDTLPAPSRDALEGIAAHIGSVINRLQTESDMRMFEAMFEHSPDGIAVTTTEGTIMYANTSYRAMSGYGDALIGMSALSLFSEEQRQVLLASVKQQVATGGSWHGVLTYQRKDGSLFPGLVTRFIIPDHAGQPHAYGAVVRDITEQRQKEQEMIDLQNQVIEAQRAALRELSTPLIPLDDHIVVMPLVGSIDTNRAQQVMETLLEGIAAQQADYAIIDITGVPVVDTQVAYALVRTAQAVQLLGSQVVLTGIGPSMAQTLVTLGADLSSIVTRGALQSGIAYAMKAT